MRALGGKVGAAQCDSEEEAQRRRLRIHLRRLCALLDLGKLEAANVVAGRGVGRAAEKPGKGLDMPDIVVLRLVAEACTVMSAIMRRRRSLIGLLLIGRPVLRLSAGPLDPQDGTLSRHRVSISWLASPSPLAPARAARARASGFVL